MEGIDTPRNLLRILYFIMISVVVSGFLNVSPAQADAGGYAEITCKIGTKSKQCPAGQAADCYCDTTNTAQCGDCRKVSGASADHPYPGKEVSVTCKIGNAKKSCPLGTRADCYCDTINQATCSSCR